MIQSNQKMLLPTFKNKIINRHVESLPERGRFTAKINRFKAREFYDTEKCDDTGEYSLFGMMNTQMRKSESNK